MTAEQRDTVDPLTRDEVAEFVLASEDKIRAAARSRLFGQTRGLYDSEDVFASVLRRCDALAQDQRIRPRSRAELLQFLRAMAKNLAVDKNRQVQVMMKLRGRIADDAACDCGELARAEDAEAAAAVLAKLLKACVGPHDRQILLLRLRGVSHRALADLCGTTEEAMRVRWMTLWRRIVRQVDEELSGG